MASLKVPPVTGMSPARVATELRVLIRDQIRSEIMRISNGGGTMPPGANGNRTQMNELIQGVKNDIRALEDVLSVIGSDAQFRRPNLTRVRVREARNILGALNNEVVRAQNFSNWFATQVCDKPPSQQVSADLLRNIDRAYALVQALPTIDNPTLGKAETTIRAITAILKVYYGLDVQGIEKLPEVMGELLESIRPDPERVVENTVVPATPVVNVETKLDRPPVLPWSIMDEDGETLDHHTVTAYFDGTMPNREEGSQYQKPKKAEWSDGFCSPEEALACLLAVRHCYTNRAFVLVDETGLMYAEAEAFGSTPITWYNLAAYTQDAIEEEANVF